MSSIKGLESGAIEPSAALRLLLTEFDKTRSDNLIQFGRNIRSFLGDYLNPPAPNRYRFSAHNLYRLREKLIPAERDYFFKIVDGTRQSIISHEKIKQLDLWQAQLLVFGARSETVTSGRNHQRQSFDELRAQLEERVANYLMSVVKARGIQTLESHRESLDHATQVARIIKDTITEKGNTLQDFRLNDERIAAVSGKLIGELPYALNASRNRKLGQDFSLDQSTRREPEQVTREQPVRVQQLIVSEFERGIDNKVVEQKVNRAVGEITEQSISRNSEHTDFNGHQDMQNSKVRDITISREQAVHRHILVR